MAASRSGTQEFYRVRRKLRSLVLLLLKCLYLYYFDSGFCFLFAILFNLFCANLQAICSTTSRSCSQKNGTPGIGVGAAFPWISFRCMLTVRYLDTFRYLYTFRCMDTIRWISIRCMYTFRCMYTIRWIYAIRWI